MPIHACALPNGSPGFQWGKSGKCYASRKDAEAQETAIYASGWKEKLLKALCKGDVEGHEFHGNQYTACSLDDVKAEWDSAGIKSAVYESKGTISVSQIVVPKSDRGSGKGTAAMESLVHYADKTGQRIILSPSTDFGASSKSRLVDFYKRFGFVENKGRNKDFTISESMYREPKVGKINLRSLLFKEDGGGAPATTTTTGHTQSSSPTSGITAYGMIRHQKKRVKLYSKENYNG